MEADGDRSGQITRRSMILAGGKATLFAILVGRMYQLQILDADQYRMLADENRVDLRLVSPLRGRIMDRSGNVLAANRLSYRVSVIAEQTKDLRHTLQQLGSLIELSNNAIDRVTKKAGLTRSFMPITVAENLEWEEFARVNAHLTDLPGIHPDAGHSRYYPHPDEFSLLVGYVGPVTKVELSNMAYDPMFLLPEFRIGKRGLELTHDTVLRGAAGTRKVEVNALGREIRELSNDQGVAGRDLTLTIDRDIQQFTVNRLGEQSAGVVVMNVRSGEVITIASTPGFNPNDFNFGISEENWRGLLRDPRKPLLNKTVQGQFPPGSTFKMIVAMTVLEKGIETERHRVTCRGKILYGNHTFHCWKRGGHGSLDMRGAIEQSCDVYFYELAKKLNVDDVAETAHMFGLGQVYDIGLDGEAAGIVPTKAWKRSALGEPWLGGETLNTCIGQGFLLATPLQLAVMTARIANGGLDVSPVLVKESEAGATALSLRRLDVSDRALKLVQEGMIGVTEGQHGTARGSRLRVDNFKMAGKTGTSQVRRISAQERATRVRKNEEKPWEERDHSLFVAYAPIDDPLYAISVVVEHGGSGSRVAAPMARDIMEQVLIADPEGLLAARRGNLKPDSSQMMELTADG